MKFVLITAPFATIVLLVEKKNEQSPVKLEDVARDLEEEGFKVERIEKDGDTRVIKVDIEVPEAKVHKKIEDAKYSILPSKYTQLRNKRSPCLNCMLHELKGKKYGSKGGYKGGYGGGKCKGGKKYKIKKIF